MKCLRCGACCRVGLIIDLMEEDMNKIPQCLTQKDNLFAFGVMKKNGNECIALEKTNDGLKTYVCGIYNCRPKVCEKFVVGSELCVLARKEMLKVDK